jgi:hypothetical protein
LAVPCKNGFLFWRLGNSGSWCDCLVSCSRAFLFPGLTLRHKAGRGLLLRGQPRTNTVRPCAIPRRSHLLGRLFAHHFIFISGLYSGHALCCRSCQSPTFSLPAFVIWASHAGGVMEPISAFGLAATCTSLISSVVKIASAIHGFREKFKAAELALLSLATQLSTLEASISELNVILNSQAATINQRPNLLEALHGALSSTTLVISYIWNEVTETTKLTRSTSVFRAGPWVRTKYVFSESGLAHMKEALRDQIQAIHLLISVAAMYVTPRPNLWQGVYQTALTLSLDPRKQTNPRSSMTRRASVRLLGRVVIMVHPPFYGSAMQTLEPLLIVSSLTTCHASVLYFSLTTWFLDRGPTVQLWRRHGKVWVDVRIQ